jgi:hypothetical protein
MAIAVEMNVRGASLEQYDQVREKMGLTQNGATPPGALFHWIAPSEDGWRVVDVWESREAFDRFAQEHIGPNMASVGLTDPPETTFYEVHNYLGRGF